MNPNLVTITEYGAAEQVAGSKLILKIGNKNILLDIGKEYRAGKDTNPLPFNAKSIDQLIFNHRL